MKFQTNKTKLIALLLLLCTLTLIFSSCARDKIDKPEDTNLEYWLLDKPNKKEWTELSNSHWLDDNHYLAKGYDPIIDENGNRSAPEQSVIYTVSRYPLIYLGIKKITHIKITDPSVYVWGLTVNSTREEVEKVMTGLGFTPSMNNNEIYATNNGNYSFTFRYDSKTMEIGYSTTSIPEIIIGRLYP